MSDNFRKSNANKISEALTPDESKGHTQKMSENISDSADKFASKITPDSRKSASQKMTDDFQSGADDAKKKSFGETAGEYLETAKKQVNEAYENLTGSHHSK